MRPNTTMSFAGFGHAAGSRVVSNTDLALSLGLTPRWFVDRTGIEERRVCAPDEDVETLAAAAVHAACDDADIDPTSPGHETVLLHIENGVTRVMPPAGIALAERMGWRRVRVLGVDGVCAEVIGALELATLLLAAGTCERVILSAAVDFMPFIHPTDYGTVGLFGAGAGAVVLTVAGASRAGPERPATIPVLRWETHTQYAALGRVRVRSCTSGDDGVHVITDFYQMRGQELARAGRRILPDLIRRVVGEANWTLPEVDVLIAHQPNLRVLEIGARVLGIDPAVIPMPVRHLGNMGPASILVNLSMAARDKLLEPGTKALLVGCGLGFTCGVVPIEFH